jgi:hypothetical protein
MLQVELMRGEDMTPPEIVQLIAWSKEYAVSRTVKAPESRCDSIRLCRYNRDMERQFAFTPDRPLLIFYDDLLKVCCCYCCCHCRPHHDPPPFQVYEQKACEKLMEWSTNIIKADRDSKPDVDPRDGLLCVAATSCSAKS